MTKTAMKTFDKVVSLKSFSGSFNTGLSKKIIFNSYMAFLVDDFEDNLASGLTEDQIEDAKKLIFSKFETAMNNHRVSVPSDNVMREIKKEHPKTPYYRVGECSGFDIKYYFWIKSVLGSKMEVYVNDNWYSPIYFKSKKGEAILMPVRMDYDYDWE